MHCHTLTVNVFVRRFLRLNVVNLRVRRRMAEGRRTRSKDHSPEEKSGGALKIAVTGQLQNVVKVLKVALALLSTASASPSPTKAQTPPLQRELSPPFTSPAIPFDKLNAFINQCLRPQNLHLQKPRVSFLSVHDCAVSLHNSN